MPGPQPKAEPDKNVTACLPAELVAELDRLAGLRDQSRSAVMRSLLRMALSVERSKVA